MRSDSGADGDRAPEREDTPRESRPFPIEESLDLHAFDPRDCRDVVVEYLWEAARLGLGEVRIIHGKGIGVQRRIVEAVLREHPAVASWRAAPVERGHYGATLAILRPAERRG